MQLHGAYLFDGILELLKKLSSDDKLHFQKLLSFLSYFEVKSNLLAETEYTPEFAVLINLLQRGLPTRLSRHAADIFNQSYSQIEAKHSDFTLHFDFINRLKEKQNFNRILFYAFHVIDPRLNKQNLLKNYKDSWEKLGSQFEERFFFNILPEILDEDYPLQLIESQRSIQSITKEHHKQVAERIKNNFSEQRTDFSFEAPYVVNDEKIGIVLEIDGPQHQGDSQAYLDTERDHAVSLSGWANTLRIKTSDFGTNAIKSKLNYLKDFLKDNTFYKRTKDACQFNFLDSTIKRELLEICLSPIAIARVQRVILEYIGSGKISKFKDVWQIAIVERDVPCAYIAVEDLKVQITHLFRLMGMEIPIPEIQLAIFVTPEFMDSPVHKFASIKPLSSWDNKERYDLVIDVSVLQRAGINETIRTANTNFAIVRSSYHTHQQRTVKSSAFINYPEFAFKGKDELWTFDKNKEIALEYFLQSVFRKKAFREGQLPIINRALNGKSVIGLLPTGGGKSLTYQLSTFLQPGITLAVDPIKSLMKDQVDGLKKNYIDSCIYINSTLRGEDKRRALTNLKSGQSQFAFISPERLQMEDFRATLTEMADEGNYFSYCVIDEAHCVSEWGHDFRTAYLRLGENALRYCKTKSGQNISLFGLTATASFDVLSDVQRELSGNIDDNKLEDDSIIRFESTKRPELQYRIERVSFPEKGIANNWDLKRALGKKKQERTIQLIQEIPEHLELFMNDSDLCFDKNDENRNHHHQLHLDEFNSSKFYHSAQNAVLIFCPHTKGHSGVTDKYKVDRNGAPVQEKNGYLDVLSVANPNLKIGFFMGSNSDDEGVKQDIEEQSTSNQDNFIESKINLLVATKAFGMGIDKESIRSTIHINYPGSIESYVQEAGRAGRDRKIALSYILFNDQQLELEGKTCEVDLDNNFYFHNNSFKGESKELAILDELLQEIYFPDRTFELENVLQQKLDIDIKVSYWERENFKGLFISKSFTEKLGYFNLSNFSGVPKDSVDLKLSSDVFEIIKKHILDQHPNEPVHQWIQQSDKRAGIQQLLDSKQVGDTFSLTIGFRNNGSERLKIISKWLQTIIHPGFSEAQVRQLKDNSQGFESFVEAVEQFYERQAHRVMELRVHCQKRDKEKGILSGTTFQKFEDYYNGYRDKMDSEKAIYRLSTLGIIDDYTVNFSANTFTLYGTKRKDTTYKQNLIKYLLKYYSRNIAEKRIKSLPKSEGDTIIEKSLSFLVKFVYDEIKKKRELAIQDMKKACYIGLNQGNIEFKDYIDLYFNSKYARKGYSFQDKITDKETNASITDLTDEGRKEEDLELVWFFIDVVEKDPKAGFLDNIKHLRGACTRLLRSQPDNYVFLLLNSFSIYQVSFKSERFLVEAEELLQKAFFQMAERDNIPEVELQEVFNHFIKLILEKNPDLPSYMDKFNLVFDFDQILISRLLKPLKFSNQVLSSLNSLF